MSTPPHLSDSEYQQIQHQVLKYSGIVLADNKKQMVLGRLMRRARVLKINDIGDYLAYLQSNQAVEHDKFINAMTTNVTAFFREAHHFDFLTEQFSSRRGDVPVKIWSAGGSTGQEAYTIAMTMVSCRCACDILVSDIDSDVLDIARQADYPIADISKVPEAMQRRFFLKGRGEHAGRVRVKDELRKTIHFESVNLLDSFQQFESFDVIFCRNVLIYFNAETKKKVVTKFVDLLSEDGVLIVGHSESLLSLSDRLQHMGRTIYRKRSVH